MKFYQGPKPQEPSPWLKPQEPSPWFVGYRPPYCWDQLLDFLAGRTISGVEIVKDGEYMRTVRLVDGEGATFTGWLQVGCRPQKNALAVTVSKTLLPVLPVVLSRVGHMFDLNCDPDIVFKQLSAMNEIRPGLFLPGMRRPGCFDPFEMAVRAVLGQQITVKAAGTLAGRLAEAYGEPVSTGVDGLTRIFPSPEAILALGVPLADYLGPLGITTARANTIRELARFMGDGSTDLLLCASPEKEIKKLMDLPGIGVWTAQYIALRAMGWADAFPHTDYGIKKALAPRTPREILALAEKWRPWRSYAAINLWNSLQTK